MSELKCPFCQDELIPCIKNQNDWIYHCDNQKCPMYDDADNENAKHLLASKELWQELIRTRKALEWARHFLKEIRLRYLIGKDSPSRQNKWADTALNMYNLTESFFDDYDKTNETKGDNNE